jgi:hypothetical protein
VSTVLDDHPRAGILDAARTPGTAGGQPHTLPQSPWLVLFPLLAPLVLLAAGNDAFGFDLPGNLDSSVYLGYFWHYPEHLWVFDDNSNYKISRLPWILPGFVAHSMAGPIAASYVLAYLSLTTGALALYLLVKESFDDSGSAAVVGVAWACCTWAHGNGGWNYQVLIAAGYYLLACWLMVRAARAPSRGPALMAGVLLAAAIHTHLFFVAFVPLVAMMFAAAVPHDEARLFSRSVRAGMLVIAGGLALTMVLGAINGATGGDWLFFVPQVEQALKLARPDQEYWWRGNVEQWLPTARYLVIPLALLIAGLTVPLSNHRNRGRRLSLTFVALAWVSLGIMCFFQFVRRQTALEPSYMAFALYPHAFACLGAVLSVPQRTRRNAAWTASAASAAILGALIFLLPAPLPQAMEAVFQPAGIARFGSIVPPLVVSVLAMVALQVARGMGRMVVFAIWFSVVNAWIAPIPAAYGMGTPGNLQSMLRVVREADRVTSAIDPTLIGIKYWMSDERLATATGGIALRHVFDSFVATRAWFTNLLGRQSPSPQIDQLTLDDLDRGACIGVLSSVDRQTGLQREMEAHFARLGRPLRLVIARQFTDGQLRFGLTVLKPQSSGEEGSAPCARLESRTSQLQHQPVGDDLRAGVPLERLERLIDGSIGSHTSIVIERGGQLLELRFEIGVGQRAAIGLARHDPEIAQQRCERTQAGRHQLAVPG